MEDASEKSKPASMILVLAKKMSSVSQTVNFLERRGFAAKIISSVSDAVELFGKKQANMLLLSVNFAHPKVEMLPSLMNQSFGIETILFAEETDRKSQTKLNNAKTKHVLFGPPTGPVVLTKIRLIERELNGSEEREGGSRSSSAQARDNDGDIKVGGKRGSQDDNTVVLNGRSGKAAIDQLMKSLDGDADDVSDADAKSGSRSLERSGAAMIQRGQRAKKISAENGELETLLGASDADEGGESAELSAELSANAIDLRSAIDQGLQSISPTQRPRLIAPVRRARRALVAADVGGTSEEKRNADLANELLEKESAAAPVTPRATSARNKKSEPTKHDPIFDAKKKPRENNYDRALTSEEKIALETEEKVRRCLREALTIVAGAPVFGLGSMKTYCSAALISLRSNTLKFSFIISLHRSRKSAAELFHRIEIAFFSLLRDHGIEVDSKDVFSIFIDNMRIVSQAFDTSDFVVVTSTPEIEIGIAEVVTKNPVATLKPYEDDMLSVEIREIPLNEPVTFNLFLHFKQNKKFIRYMKHGSTLSSPQARRLEGDRVTLLLESQDREAYRRHCAAFAIQATPRKKSA